MYIVVSYIAYIAISIAVTIWVARTLHLNGRVFLVNAFTGNEPLADSVNHLLVAGFYLINVGWITLSLRTAQQIEGTREAIELVSAKIGTVLLVLGCMHFLNLYIFNRLRTRGQEQADVQRAILASGARPRTAAGWAPDNAPLGHVLD